MAKYNLVGVDSNAFCIMGYVTKAMKREYKRDEEIDAYRKDAESSDYMHLLGVSLDMVDTLNDEIEKNKI